jgi:SAM-dependent methyltransferase
MITFAYGTDFQERMRSEIYKTPLSSQSNVLNIACEYDLVPSFLRKDISENQVFGIEINKEIVEKNDHIRYCDVDRDAFPFPDQHFDLVLSIFGIEHFKKNNVFKEAHRVLKPGGRFVFIVPNVYYPMFLMNRILGEQFARFYYRRVVKSSYMPHRAYYRFNSPGKIERLSKQIGFKSTNITMFGPSNVLSYVRKYPWAQSLVRGFERLLTNSMLCRLKPYLIVVLER